MKNQPAFMLIVVLLVAALVMTLGLGYLSGNSPRYNASVYAKSSAQAKALAEAGLEDARVKLQKDPRFPPIGDATQTTFAYRETLQDLDGQLAGSYVVTLDWTYLVAPYYVVVVTSQGLVGPDPAKPTGNCVLHAEFDLRAIRSPDTKRDADYGRILNFWEDAQ